MPKEIILVCGEPSGELNAAGLIRAIKEINPEIKISAVGSDLLRAAGAEVFYDIRGLAVLGLFDVLRKLPKFIRLKKIILQKIEANKPAAIIFVDFSGFNLRLAKAINHKIPTIYYVSPQVWASRPGRIKTIKKYISKMLVVFAFEKEFYAKFGVEADFVGHPLLDTVKPSVSKEDFLKELGFSQQKKTLALLPGSRKGEVKHILPIMLEAARQLKNFQLVIAKAKGLEWKVYRRILRKSGLEVAIAEAKTYDCLNICDFALVASGTATLETALMQKPFALIYKMGWLNYLLYRPQVRLPYIGMVNIVAGRKIIPEFIQFHACPRKIADFVQQTLADTQKLATLKQELSLVRLPLGEPGASQRAARLILKYLVL
jgi:lipid-A-disaccharide synthase